MRAGAAELMTPNPGAPSVVPGIPKFGWFRMLKASARNCTRYLSAKIVFFTSTTGSQNRTLIAGYLKRRGVIIWGKSASRGRLSSHLDSGGAQMPDSRCVQSSAPAALSPPLGKEQARTTSSSVLSVRRRERKWPAAGGFAGQLALHCGGKTRRSGISGRLMAHDTQPFPPGLVHCRCRY